MNGLISMKISALKIVEAVLDLPANQHRLNLTRLTVLIAYLAGKSKTQSCLSFLVDKGQLMSNFTMIMNKMKIFYKGITLPLR